MVASPLTGLSPMLASKAVGVTPATLVGTHVFDEKLDGLRAMVATDGNRVWLRGRKGADLLPHFPEIESGALVTLREGVVLDGEITTTTFEDVNHRAMMAAQRISVERTTLPVATFNAFDVLRHPDVTGKDLVLVEAPWQHRRYVLDELRLTGRFRATTVSTNPEYFDTIRARGGEGVIAKRLASRYRAGRSADWLKFKATSRITCIAYGYAPGSGSRAAFGAVLLAVLSEDMTPTEIGRAGSGFTDRTITQVKAGLDAGTPLVIEVECLGLTSGGQLRQPVFKGVRADLTILDATSTQLNNLPKG